MHDEAPEDASLSALASGEGKWLAPGAGLRYASARFKNARAARRDPLIVERLLARHAPRSAREPLLDAVLDAPCGTGRLRAVIERGGRRYVGADLSATMLVEAARESPSALCRADVARLPFADASFDVVVCCRLLHHLDEDRARVVVKELVRVARRIVVVSFWDAASLHAWRRRVGLRRGEGPLGRRATTKRALRRLFDEAGAEVAEFEHSFRFVSQQAFAVAHKRAPVKSDVSRARRFDARALTVGLPRATGSLGQA